MTDLRAAGSAPIQVVYGAQGVRSERVLACAGAMRDLTRVPTIADLVAVTEIMTREITCARRDLSTEQIVDLMVRNRIGCVPVVEDRGRPVGMVTKSDLLEQLLAVKGIGADDPSIGDLLPCTANELMMPFAITLGERATVAHAAALMTSEDIHHIPIVDDHGRMIGVVSTMDIARWLATNDGFRPLT